jgi:hypothetical protein
VSPVYWFAVACGIVGCLEGLTIGWALEVGHGDTYNGFCFWLLATWLLAGALGGAAIYLGVL